MKHIINPILILALLISLSGCSSDDKPEQIKYPVAENIIGRWYMIGYDSGNGYVEYKSACSDKRDYLEFLETMHSTEKSFAADCETGYTINAVWKVTNDINLSLNNDEDSVGRYYTVSQLTGDRLGLQSQTQTALGGSVMVTNYYSK